MSRILTDKFIEYLRSVRTDFSVKDGGEIYFFSDGWHFTFKVMNDDPYYFRMILQKVDEIKDNRDEIAELVNDINIRFKGIKATIQDGFVWLSSEQKEYLLQW